MNRAYTLRLCLLFCFVIFISNLMIVQAKPLDHIVCPPDSSGESKVDYLEKLYFSHKNKEGLISDILITLQQLESGVTAKSTSTGVAAQYTFLNGIRDKAAAAESACDITDMLAAGIHSLDVSEAVAQGIPRPSTKVNANLGSVLSSAQNVGSSAGSLAWNAFALSNGKYNALGAASKLGAGASALGNSLGTAKELGNIAGALLKKADKPCKTVPEKVITIGLHPASQPPQTEATVAQNNSARPDDVARPEQGETKTIITFLNIDYAKLTLIDENIKACDGVKTTSKKFASNKATITVTHTGTTDQLIALMLQTCKGSFNKNNISSADEGAVEITLK